MNVTEQIADLIEQIEIKDGNPVLTDEVRAMVHEIAGICEKSPAYQKNLGRAWKYSEGLTAEEVYLDMIYKVGKAPTHIHAEASAILLMPVLDRKLREKQ